MISSEMASRADTFPMLKDAAERAASELVRVSHWGDSSYINLPMFMPGGSPATVRVTGGDNSFRVDDGGFAYREAEAIGGERSFSRAAVRFAQAEGLTVGKRAISTMATADELQRAICDVGAASYSTAHDIYQRIADEGLDEIQDYLRERLETVFQGARIESEQTLKGASTHDWTVSNVIYLAERTVVFQAVGNHAYSIYRASTAFHDLGELPAPPQCVAVVKDLHALGANLNVLAQAGRVIQGDQTDDAYRRAAA
jgi:hypothetical protein